MVDTMICHWKQVINTLPSLDLQPLYIKVFLFEIKCKNPYRDLLRDVMSNYFNFASSSFSKGMFVLQIFVYST